MSQPALVLYLPVIHKGYLTFLRHYPNATIFVLADEIAQQYKVLRKDIRALSASQVVTAVQALLPEATIQVVGATGLGELNSSTQTIIMPDEEPMAQIATTYFPQAVVEYAPVVLRWDSKKTLEQQGLDAHQEIRSEPLVQQMMQVAKEEASKSHDQWRQVGAVLVKEGEILQRAHNHHLPDHHQPHYQGDLRGNFSQGQHIELTTAQHAEASLVAWAAKEGVSLRGADVFVTTFPCPVCAKLLAETGIQNLYFAEGYSMADGLRVMQEAEIGVYLVK